MKKETEKNIERKTGKKKRRRTNNNKKIYMPCGRRGVRPFICIYIIHS